MHRRSGDVVGRVRTPRGQLQGKGDVTLNFAAVSVQEAAKAILGDLLGLNYTVDPSVQGNVTVQTTGPVHRDQILPIFEASLEAAKLVIVQQGDIYTVAPLAAGQHRGTVLDSANQGYGTETVTLKYVNGSALKKILDPLVPDNGISQSDASRNVLFITGSVAQRRSMRDLIRQFDINWLKGMSFALFVPQWSDSKDLADQLDKVLNAEGTPTAGLIRLVPIQQMNAILAISNQQDYLDRVRDLIGNLDKVGQDNQRRLFVYKVQNGRAADLAGVLASSLGGGSAQGGQLAGSATGLGTAGAGGQIQNGSQSAMGTSRSGFGNTGSSSGTTPQSGPGTSQSAGASSQTVDMGDGQKSMTITSDDENNALVIYSTPQQYRIVEDALHKLDVRPLQVMIEATIGEVTLTDELHYGLQWYFRQGKHSAELGEGKTNALVQNFPGFSYMFSEADTNVVLNALTSLTTVNVLSSPELFVLNNHTASLQVGDQVPITTQSAVSIETANAPLVNSVEYRDTGVILKVTPRVNDSGLVLLDIAQEVSDVASTDTSNIDSPTIQQRRIASTVAVQDGQTIVLGGLIKDNRSNTKAGLPFLRDIPGIGELFGSRDKTHDRTELMVLLTPRVVRSSTDVRALTEELQRRLPAVTPLFQKEPPA
ncbi:MAG TPA: type II secretion system secretin GspD [Rhizomicrobium sp.]|jgi:general secretion pathway protein D